MADRPPKRKKLVSHETKLKDKTRNHRYLANEQFGHAVFEYIVIDFPDEPLVKDLAEKADDFEAQQRSGPAGSQPRNLNRNIRRYKSMLVRHTAKDGEKGVLATADELVLRTEIEALMHSTESAKAALDLFKRKYEEKWKRA